MAVRAKHVDLFPTQTIHQLFEQQVDYNPFATAVVLNDNILTYSEINDQSNRLAHFLMSVGVGSESLIGVMVHRSFAMIVAILAILKAGGAYVPIDPNYPKQRIAYILNDAEVSLLLTQQALLAQVPATSARLIALDQMSFSAYSSQNPELALSAKSLAYLLYTSGSTGNPKGVMVEHGNVIETFLSWQAVYQLTSQDCHLQMASFSFDVFSGDLARSLCSGAKLVLCPKNYLLKPEKLYHLMKTQKINCAEFVPTILRRLVDYVKVEGSSLDFMRLLLCGSDSWSLGEYRALKKFCGNRTRVVNSYGLTEATIDSTWFEENAKSPVPLADNQYVPLGTPFPHTEILLLDEQLKPVSKGSTGEIYIAGAGVARGYYKRPELTKERFINHRFQGKSVVKLYKTGDQGCYLPDGNIQFLGRIDNQIKLRGMRVELSEIEHAIKKHPTVNESAVILNDNDPNHPRLVAYIVFAAKAHATEAELRHFLAAELPNHLLPHIFIEVEALALTPNGKIDRQALKNRK